MKRTNFAAILMLVSFTLASASDARAQGGWRSGGSRGSLNGGQIVGGILGGIAQGLQQSQGAGRLPPAPAPLGYGGGSWGNNGTRGFKIPFGNGGGVQIGSSGIRVQTPDQHGDDHIIPGKSLTIPFPQRRPQPTWQPQYRPYQPRYPQVQPRPQRVPSTPAVPKNTVLKNAVPKNTLLQTKKKPHANPDVNDLVRRRLMEGTAETDARQAVEAEKINKVLDADLTARVSGAVASGADPQIAKDWGDVLAKGSTPEDIADFQKTWGKDLGNYYSNADFVLNYRVKLGEYSEALTSGTLSSAGKDQALVELRQMWDKGVPFVKTKTWDTISQHIDNMQDFNDLGKLGQLATDADNPLPILVQGVTNAGLPIALVSDMSGLPIMAEACVSDSTSPRLSQSTVIHNPAENGEEVSYLLGSHSYTMKPGEQQTLNHSYIVAFDPGNGGPRLRRQLKEGTYEWRLIDEGWDIYQVQVKVTLDNSAYDGDFQYLLDNEHKTLGAGEVVEHTSSLPIEIVFDRGDGEEPARKILESGTYMVGVDSDEQRLDLFPFDESYESEPEMLNSIASGDSPRRPSHGDGTDRRHRVEELLQQLESRQSSQERKRGDSAAASEWPLLEKSPASASSFTSVTDSDEQSFDWFVSEISGD